MKIKQQIVASTIIAMRFTITQLGICILFACSLYAKEANSQPILQKSFTLSVENVTLNKVIISIQKQTKVKFTFSPNSINAGQLITYAAKNKTIADFVTEILTPLKIGYQVIDEQVILFSMNSPAGSVQYIGKENPVNKDISGLVKDDKGEALAGVTVAEKGTPNAVATNEAGFFKISVPEGNTILVFSSTGYESQEVAVKNATTLNIILKTSSKSLEDVVVVGYGTQKKKDLTGSVASVNTKDLRSLPVPSIGEALQGRAAGLQVLSSGAPGSNVTLRVRGIGTINNSDPLLVIDGVPTDVPLNTINPDDISNIEVLKDASSAAIYGARGANGVVIITTKRGSSTKNALEFKMFAGQQKAMNVVEMLDATQFASLNNEMMINNGQPQNPAYADPLSLGKGTNWLNALFRKAPIQSYSLSYSGGSAKSTYYVSGAILNQDGIVINTNYKRYNIQFNTDNRLFDWLRVGNNLTLNTDSKKSGDYDIRNTMSALPGQSIYNENGTYSGPVGDPKWYGDVTNPIGKATLTEKSTKGNNILGNIYAEISFLKSLKFKTTGGVQASFWDERTWSPKYDWKPIPQPSSFLFQQSNKAITWLWDNYFTYDNYFNKDHHLTLLAGTSFQTNRYDWMNGSIKDFANDNTQEITNGTTIQSFDGNASEWSLFSYIGRVNYAFDNKYLVTATIRRDASSRFGANYRWGTFPSGSVAWRISQEPFMKNIRWLNDLKIRAGYGLTGNQNIGNYSFTAVLSTGEYNFGSTTVPTVIANKMSNPNIHWEEVEQSNIGFDATLFNNRINVTLDAYIKNTNDMLVLMDVPVFTGYSDVDKPFINAGKVQNKGVELNITTQTIKGAFEWSTSFNISYNKNKVISLNDDVPLLAYSIGLNQNLAYHKNGLPVSAFYGFLTNGLFQNQKEADEYAFQVGGNDPNNSTSAGDIKFKDINNNGVIDDNDRTYIGNPSPRYIFAMNNSFGWKGIDLSIFLQGIEGNDIYNANRIYQEGMAVAQNQTTAVLNRWTGAGTSNTMPRAIFNDPNKNSRVSDRYIEDGSYLKIKNVTVGYTFPRSLTQQAKIQSARIYLSAQNLATFTKYTGFDPEVPANGIDLNVYPVTRIMSAGVNLVF